MSKTAIGPSVKQHERNGTGIPFVAGSRNECHSQLRSLRHDDYSGRVSNCYRERCTNEKGLKMAAHLKISAERKQRSINGDD